VAARAVRIITEVAAVDRPFDYALDDSADPIGLGDRVRVDFNHRSVRGWVIDEAVVSSELKTIKKWLGFGPPRPCWRCCSGPVGVGTARGHGFS